MEYYWIYIDFTKTTNYKTSTENLHKEKRYQLITIFGWLVLVPSLFIALANKNLYI